MILDQHIIKNPFFFLSFFQCMRITANREIVLEHRSKDL